MEFSRSIKFVSDIHKNVQDIVPIRIPDWQIATVDDSFPGASSTSEEYSSDAIQLVRIVVFDG